MFWVILSVTSVTLLYFYLTWNYNYWRNRGINGPKPRPLVGTFPKSAIYLRNFVYELDDIYKTFRGKCPFVGIYTYRQPELLILDPKLINEIFVGKFKHFENNYTNYNKENARLFMRNPFILRDQEWKDNRADISPAFTTLKTKQTYPVVDRMCKKLTKFIKSQIENGVPFTDTKEITAKFTADVICSVAYGLEANAIENNNSEFLRVAHKLFATSNWKLWFITFKSIFPYLFKYYEMPFLAADVEKYFLNLTDEAIRIRSQSVNKPDDYLHFLLKLKEKRNFQLNDVAAHSITFFLDAYETSSIILTHALYRLAKNENCQRKLRQEIAELNGDLSFDSLSNLSYLDQVFNETLRISTPGFTMSKVCTEKIDLLNHENRPVTIEKDTVIHIPIYSIHNDPEYFPEPTIFNPDRFKFADLKSLRDNGLFFPFGHGPRMCLGMRFSTLQIKAAIAEIVSNFHISVNARTKEPIIVKPKDFLYLAIGEVYLDYKVIEKENK
ncbi:putative cytochrome P450 28a5 [Pseudolycoriella hygida]|uniref:Cytochrome P450 28a5 n=1 Tax=Pseudolycoriella hygida TaxID=35572 RepID=A0A9Q0MPC5_9DIPT|nr:putative cytochrome P450 28a5 [Pseudolycoriella hygida]